jgi:hypothetical protein
MLVAGVAEDEVHDQRDAGIGKCSVKRRSKAASNAPEAMRRTSTMSPVHSAVSLGMTLLSASLVPVSQ